MMPLHVEADLQVDLKHCRYQAQKLAIHHVCAAVVPQLGSAAVHHHRNE